MNSIPLAHDHDHGLVLVSIIIAIVASYSALNLAGRVAAAQGSTRLNWLLGGGIAMGTGIWSMHFTAMLAFKLPIPVVYDVPIVIVSLGVAIVASDIALYVASLPQVRNTQLVVSGLVMGIAIAAMHYIGMEAMRLEATLTYDPLIFILSIIIAISASIAALWLAIKFRADESLGLNWMKIASAVVMGAAISGMHFTGMRAAIFTPTKNMAIDLSRAIDISTLGVGSIVLVTFLILGLALLLSIVDQRLARQASKLAIVEEQHNTELQELNAYLEQYVADLQLVFQISNITSSILDQTELFTEVVHQVQSRFDYYHVHLYLFDEQKEMLRVVGETGPAGQMMLQQRHQIPHGKGLVGQAAASNSSVLVSDVRHEPNWLPNDLLPDTKSEAAVPITFGNEVMGVLNVQHTMVNGLQQRDVDLLQLIANQVAATLQNSAIFTQVEQALAQTQAAQNRYQEQAWQQIRMRTEEGRYHYARPEVPILEEAALSEAKQQALLQNRLAIVPLKGHQPHQTGPQTIVTPITLQDQNIGTIQLHPLAEDQIWSEGDLAIVAAVVDQFAQTAENLRLFDETHERAGREATIREITDKLRAAPNLDTLLETAARELGQQLGVRHTVLELGIEATESMPDGDKQTEPNGTGTEVA